MENKESPYCYSTSTAVGRVHADVSGVCVVSGGRTQEVCAGVVVTFDPELREEDRGEPVAGVDTTADVVVVGAGVAAGVAVKLVATVATVTPSAEAADC